MLGVNTPALPASLRRTNQRTFVSLLLRLGCASRADLAKAAGISQPTAGKITAELLELGLLQPVEEPSPAEGCGQTRRLGRPGQMLRLDTSRPRFAAIELGVDKTSIAVLPVAANLEAQWAVRFPTPATPEAWARQLKKHAAALRCPELWATLISVPGIVDEPGSKVLFCPNLHWLERVDLPRLVREAWNLPALLVQEIRALALGQITAEPGGEDFLLVDFGQGVGGAIVLNGQLYPGPMPLNGELGHTRVFANDRPCGCGARGCLETLVSQQGLLKTFAANTTKTAPSWADLAACLAGRPLESWLRDSLAAAGRVIAGALNVLGIRRVVITGVLGELPAEVMNTLSAEILKGAIWARFGQVTCQAAPRLRAAGLVAAGLDRFILPAEEEPGLGLPQLAGARKPKTKSRKRRSSSLIS